MILYRKEAYPLQMKNIMLLDDEETGGVVYVSKDTYDQCVMLLSRFDGDVDRVLKTINCKKTEAYIVNQGLKQLMENACKTFPKPLNMIAPFLIFCTQNLTMDWSNLDREAAYGILHQYSLVIDFNATTLVPAEVRNNITLPTTLLLSYKSMWEELCSSLTDRIMLEPKAPVIEVSPVPEFVERTVEPVHIPTVVQSSEVTATEEEEEEEEDPFLARIAAISADLERQTSDAKSKEEKALEKLEEEDSSQDNEDGLNFNNTNEAAESRAVLDEFDC